MKMVRCLFAIFALGVIPGYGATVGVTVRDNFFTPTNVVIRAGDRVVWTNLGNVTHNSVSTTNLWHSGNLGNSASYGFTFTNLGYYSYRCTLHPFSPQTGTVSVVSISLASMARTPTNAQFEIRGGRQGLRAVVEAGGTLGAFLPISTNPFPAGGIARFTNNAPPATNRYYRARAIP
jgi:plastocyanin